MAENSRPTTPTESQVMANALEMRHQFNQESERRGEHPFALIMEARMAEASDSALKRLEIKEHYMVRDGIVSDIHGLDDPEFTKLRDALLTQRFDRIFFLGDIGGSPKLDKLQKLFYNSFLNGYRDLRKQGKDEEEILEKLKPGYLSLLAYEKALDSYDKKPAEEIDEELSLLTEGEILEGMRKRGAYGHYGHYVSNLSEQAVVYLSADVEHYYERFASLVAEIRLNTGTKVYLMEGNWDARLPMDYERDNPEIKALPRELRRFNVREYFKDHGVPYFTNVGFVENDESLVVMVPFDSVAKGVDEKDSLITSEKLAEYKQRIAEAKSKNKTVIMMSHAVPDWQKHGKIPNQEGFDTEKNLQRLLAEFEPDELVYGHEHYIRKDDEGNNMDVNSKYIARYNGDGLEIGEDVDAANLPTDELGTVISHLPIPREPFLGYAAMEIPRWPVKNKRPRGAGGKRAPVKVGKEIEVLRRIGNKLPTSEILKPVS